MLDEPTTYKTIVMVLHDLNLAVRYSDWMIVMRDGAVITTEPLEAAFGLRRRFSPTRYPVAR